MFRFLVIFVFVAISRQSIADPPSSELEIAARKYRLNVYSTYRNHRATYDQLIRTGKGLHADWEQNPNRRNTETVTAWFVQAGKAARTFGQPLPPLPSVEAIVYPAQERPSPDNSSSSLSTPWPKSPARIETTQNYSPPVQELASVQSFLLIEDSTPIDLTAADIDSSFIESPIPAYSMQRDPKRQEFGSSINLNMLIARIESENLRLKLLEEKLNHADAYSTSELKLVAAEFAEIADNRRLTEMYWGNLGREQKQITPRLFSLEPVEALLNRLRRSTP